MSQWETLALDGQTFPMYLQTMPDAQTETPTIKISIQQDFEADLAQCMAKMGPRDSSGNLRSITIQDAIREAVRRMAKGGK